MAPADIIGRLPLLRLSTAIVPMEDMFSINGSTRYSSEEEELHLRGGLAGVGGEDGGLDAGGEGEVGEVAVCMFKVVLVASSTRGAAEVDVCALVGSMGISKFVNTALVAFVVGEFVVFVFLTLLRVVREVVTEGWRDRI